MADLPAFCATQCDQCGDVGRSEPALTSPGYRSARRVRLPSPLDIFLPPLLNHGPCVIIISGVRVGGEPARCETSLRSKSENDRRA